jgi:hypothetical protein
MLALTAGVILPARRGGCTLVSTCIHKEPSLGEVLFCSLCSFSLLFFFLTRGEHEHTPEEMPGVLPATGSGANMKIFMTFSGVPRKKLQCTDLGKCSHVAGFQHGVSVLLPSLPSLMRWYLPGHQLLHWGKLIKAHGTMAIILGTCHAVEISWKARGKLCLQ